MSVLTILDKTKIHDILLVRASTESRFNHFNVIFSSKGHT